MKKKFDGFVRKFCKTKTFSIFVVQTSPKKFSELLQTHQQQLNHCWKTFYKN
jgi:hypothetical protein